jgi:pilus assembly protein CpaB
MRAKSMLLILIALGCGLVASIAISQVMERGAKSGNAGLEMVQIYVATADIDVNEQLTASNVRVEDWPKSKIPEGAIVDFKQINERFARVRFYQGEPILEAKLANEIEGPAIKIPDGHRVCSLKVQMEQAVSNLINPGDRVDIFGYFREGRGIPITGTREILTNVRVFAVNERTETETDQEGRTIAAKTVSVLVKEDQVAKLMLAAELGTLRLALRRPNESLENDTKRGGTATVESLFGTHSETADDRQQPKPISPLASATGGLVGFFNNLKSQNPAAAAAVLDAAAGSLPNTDLPQREPAWQMTLLTPEGSTQFTWSDAHGLPDEIGGAASARTPATPTAAAVPPSTPDRVSPPPSAGTGAVLPAPATPDKSPAPEPTQETDQNTDKD